MRRREFVSALGLAAFGCADRSEHRAYADADKAALAAQRLSEAQASGKGPYGAQRYQGYRALADLPWFELDEAGELRCVDDSFDPVIDFHAHLGISVLFEPRLDLLKASDRVQHLLDCDRAGSECELDLDIYVNGNFDEEGLEKLADTTLTQGLWGNSVMRTHTVPNLLNEMKNMRVGKSVLLPIKLGLPFGDNLYASWQQAIQQANATETLYLGQSVHPDDGNGIEAMRFFADAGSRVIKLHPTVQKFYPDEERMLPIYEEAQALNLVVFFHGGRAGVEPEGRQNYALPRFYEKVLANFPKLQVVLGHAGARDGLEMLDLALRHDNAWLGIHGQGVSRLKEILQRTGGERVLFGTDWPWYHQGATLAKVLLCTNAASDRSLREQVLSRNALALLPELAG
ncbi:MAG: amidohydrolase family protein [Pseudomonadota bacterium]